MRPIGAMTFGYLAAGVVHSMVAVLVRLAGGEWLPGWLPLYTILLLSVGDVVAIKRNSYHIFGLRRQARRSLAFREHSDFLVGIVWGFDAGIGATFRVTSGLWALLILASVGQVSPMVLVFVGVGFGVSLAVVSLLPLGESAGAAREEAAIARVIALSENVRPWQLIYLLSLGAVLLNL